MTTTTTTLSDFLMARITDDEALSSDAGRFGKDETPHRLACGLNDVNVLPCDCGYPARVLAECAAKRAIVEEFKVFSKVNAEAPEGLPLPQALTSAGIVTGLERAVRHLAAVYSDHADYDPSWAVS